MKNKIIYISIIVLQIVLLAFFIHSKSGVKSSATRLVLSTRMLELQRFTENNLISISYPINQISSLDAQYEVADYPKNSVVYVKLKQENNDWIPAFFGSKKPDVSNSEVLLCGNISEVARKKQFTFSYTKNGKKHVSSWMGNIRKAKKGKNALLALDPADPGKIEYATSHMEYDNRVEGRLMDIKPVPGKELAYTLVVQFKDSGRSVNGRYPYINTLKKPLPPIGSPVSISFVKADKSYRVTYVELEPLTPAKIKQVSMGYVLDIKFGIEQHLLKASQKTKLNELIDTFGDTDVSVEVAVDADGKMALTALFIGEEKVSL